MTTPPAVCPDCQGTGFFARDVPVEHPDFGQAFPCHCPTAARRRQRMAKAEAFSQLDLLPDKAFATFLQAPPGYDEQSRASLRQAFALCQGYTADAGTWLFLHGPNGCGKTHLAAAVANAWVDQGQAVLFAPYAERKDFLRSTLTRHADALPRVTEQLRKVARLVLDDYQGADTREETWAGEKVRQILEHRFYVCQPTMITLCAPEDRMDDWLTPGCSRCPARSISWSRISPASPGPPRAASNIIRLRKGYAARRADPKIRQDDVEVPT